MRAMCAAAFAAVLASGCGATLQSAAVTPNAPQALAALQTASATPTAAQPFNPFAADDGRIPGARVVIENPTLAQVLKPGPLKEMALGRTNAPVTVIKYASPTCPFCRRFDAKTFPMFKRAYIDTGKVRYIVREFPIGFQSGAATIAIRCAPENQRLKLYSALLRNQARWVSQEVRRDPIFQIARKFGVSRQKFDACFADQKLIADLKVVKDRGRTLGIIGTPNFFVNEKLEKRVLTMDDFRALIDPLVAGQQTAQRPTQ
ncbi:MAG: thioredoxin domain-containing protein [Pseudomonadota bacterium]